MAWITDGGLIRVKNRSDRSACSLNMIENSDGGSGGRSDG